ncbi:hypothetical protein EDD11_006744 [Mortierella claussenii]|nr:hypothetical protein EDD11_006744 [Mortierella claussenii]
MTKHLYQQFRQAEIIRSVPVRTAIASEANGTSSCFVSLEDIRDVFKDAQLFELDGHPIPFLPGLDGSRNLSPCIAFYPDNILDVVTEKSCSSNSNTVVHCSTLAEVRAQTSGDHLLSSSSLAQPVNSTFIARNVEQTLIVNSENKNVQQIMGLLLDVKDKTDKMLELQLEAKAKDDKILALQLEAKENHSKMLHMQAQLHDQMNQALDRLAILQKHAHAILVQNFELHEYPIPRLFIILPVDHSKWDPKKVLENKFRLHFLCECGDHTVEASKSDQDCIHIAKHEGYEFKNGTDFFLKYGKYILVLLQVLKTGLHSVDITVPHVPASSLLSASIDCSIDYMRALSVANPVLKNINTIDDYEALEGADLRQLDTFLRTNDDSRTLGNLYRTTTERGHVKWVCIDHFRSTYKEKEQQAFANAVEMHGGSYDPQLGRVVIKLQSKIRAAEFFNALANARRVYDLDISFVCECSRSDLEAFEYALKTSRVSILLLDLMQFRTSLGSKLFSTSTRYEVLARIMEHSHLRIVHIALTKDFIRISSLQPKQPSHLQKLSFEMNATSIGGNELETLTEVLKTNSTLITLTLCGKSIGDNGVLALSEALKTNPTLTTLTLWGDTIGDNGAFALFEALKINSTLTTLDLRGILIGDDGALVLSEALKTNSTLTTLGLWRNSIGDNGAFALSEALKTNSTLTALDLRDIPIGDDGALVLFEALKTNSTLTTLTLWNNSIGDSGAFTLSEALKTNSTLTTLDLRENPIGDDGALVLFEALKTNSTLTTLTLWNNSIGDSGAFTLSEALKTNSTLTTLDLRENPIGDNGALVLSEALKTNSTLTTLNLRSILIGDNGALVLSEVLKINSTLTTLDLGHIPIGDDGALVLSEALKTNSTLTTLTLWSNSIGDNGALALSESLKTNSALTTLNLGYNSIGDNGALALSESLKTNSALTILDLWRNSIGDNGAFALSEALKTNSTLTTLGLWRNSIGDNGAFALSEALKTNSTLTTLDLRGNPIGDNGALAQYLVSKTSRCHIKTGPL